MSTVKTSNGKTKSVLPSSCNSKILLFSHCADSWSLLREKGRKLHLDIAKMFKDVSNESSIFNDG